MLALWRLLDQGVSVQCAVEGGDALCLWWRLILPLMLLSRPSRRRFLIVLYRPRWRELQVGGKVSARLALSYGSRTSW